MSVAYPNKSNRVYRYGKCIYLHKQNNKGTDCALHQYVCESRSCPCMDAETWQYKKKGI